MQIASEIWQPKDELQFDPNAWSTIISNYNIALMAGPGSGKTEVLAQRACFLLETNTTSWPKNILSITRKREAASNIKNRVEKRCGNILSQRFHSYTIEAFTKSILDRFITFLPKNERPNINYEIEFGKKANFPKSLTFDQITLMASKIISLFPLLLKSIRATYSHVFIDEFQDLNQIQYDFIKLLFCNNSTIITVVGDTKQAIMKFANALPDIFVKFQTDFKSLTLHLNVNHRASTELRSFLNRIALKWWPQTPEVNYETILLPDSNYGIYCFTDEIQEAKELSKIIRDWIIKDKIQPCEIAILFRINTGNNYSNNISQELISLNILSINESAIQDHLSEPIGKILISFINLSTRERDSTAWETLSDLFLFSRNGDEYSNHKSLNDILEFITSNKYKFDDSNNDVNLLCQLVLDFFNLFFNGTLEATWPQYAQGELATDTVSSLLYEIGNNKNSKNTWRDAIDLISGINAVRMMTIHKSKGLEFRAVILLGFEDYQYFRYGADFSKIDEERSTIFVALSRAKEKLIISASKYRCHTKESSFKHIKPIINDIITHGIKVRNITPIIENVTEI